MKKFIYMKVLLASLPVAALQFLLELYKVVVLPDLKMISFLFILMFLEFASWIPTTICLSRNRVIHGFKKRVIRSYQIFSVLGVTIFVATLLNYKGAERGSLLMDFATHWGIIGMMFVELVYLLKNVQTLDPQSKISVYLIEPLLELLTFEVSKFGKRVKKMIKDEDIENTPQS